jgi:hypothetical protein
MRIILTLKGQSPLPNFLLKLSGILRLKVASASQCKMSASLKPIVLGLESELDN